MKSITNFTRKCPICEKDLFYGTLKRLKVGIKKNTRCYQCANKGQNNPCFGKSPTPKTRKKLSLALSGRKRTKKTIDKHKENYKKGNGLFSINHLKGKDHPNYGKVRSKKFKLKLSKAKTGVPLSKAHREAIIRSLTGRTHSEETKQKQRISKIRYIKEKNGGVAPRYNVNACKYFKKLEKDNGWDGFYATKNKEYCVDELGYFLDYYEPKLNIVIEYDEPRHYTINGDLIKKDTERMNQIKNKLKCKFFRFNEKTQELREY